MKWGIAPVRTCGFGVPAKRPLAWSQEVVDEQEAALFWTWVGGFFPNPVISDLPASPNRYRICKHKNLSISGGEIVDKHLFLRMHYAKHGKQGRSIPSTYISTDSCKSSDKT